MAPRGFLLDTDFLIDLNRSRRNVLRQRAEKLLLSINDADLFISSVAVTEFLTGVPEGKQEIVKKMLKEQYFYLAPAYEDAVLAGKLRREERQERQGDGSQETRGRFSCLKLLFLFSISGERLAVS